MFLYATTYNLKVLSSSPSDMSKRWRHVSLVSALLNTICQLNFEHCRINTVYVHSANIQFVDTCYATGKLVILHVSKGCTNAFNILRQYTTIVYIHILFFELRTISNS